jgi:type IV pilus assembly protein PilN
MIRVNLLPHREMRRRRLQQQFFIMLGVVGLLGFAVWGLVHTSLANRYEQQLGRNTYLQEQIVKLDKEIADIKKLREMTAALLARKKIVETLQSNRAEVVHLLDELARQLPDGVYLKAIKQQGSRVTISGYTQSQARVSTLMRNLDASPHIENSSLIEIKAVPLGTTRINEFTLGVAIERLKQEEDRAKSSKPASAGSKAGSGKS